MSWHASRETLAEYAAGDVDEAGAYSVEAHVTSCEQCREALGSFVPASRLDAMWRGIAERVTPDRRPLGERVLRWLGVPEHVAVLLAATPSLTLSWVAAVAVALGFAAAAAYAGEPGRLVFLVVAPLVPLAGVGVAYGPGIDPAYEVGVAAPTRGYRLVFVRSVAVVSVSIALAAIAALALPGLQWTAAAWLLPALALSAAGLALASIWPAAWAFGGIAAVWVAVVMASEVASPVAFPAFRPPAQVAFAVVLAASVAVLARRRESFDARRPA